MPGYRRLHILVEGATEETIVRNVLAPHLESMGWCITTNTLITKRVDVGPARRGGVGSWSMLRKPIGNLLRDSSLALLTTMFDYYGFPQDAPGMSDRPPGSALERVRHVERELKASIADVRFVPHLVLHEVEAWVFAGAHQLAERMGDPRLAQLMLRDVRNSAGPEGVNDGRDTAPSKRLLRHCPTYSKPLDGPEVVQRLGLPALREQCPHANEWLRELEQAAVDQPGGGEVHTAAEPAAGDTRR